MRENNGAVRSMALLDSVRIRDGREPMRDEFHRLWGRDRTAAVGLLNDHRLGFASLYALRPEIGKLDLETRLSSRNRRALELSASLSDRSYRPRSGDREALQWMFMTGYSQDDLGDCYDAVMDRAAVLLVREHHDSQCLEPLLTMIFARHRRGRYTFDAEWAFFECRDPGCIAMVAARLDSGDYRDGELARRMLSFVPCLQDGDDPAGQRRRVTDWARRNGPYLYYTGESGQKGSDPCRFRLSPENKYLHKPLTGGGGMPSLSPAEQRILEGFAPLPAHDKTLLSECSHRLRLHNRARWDRFMAMPVEDQLRQARRLAGEEARP